MLLVLSHATQMYLYIMMVCRSFVVQLSLIDLLSGFHGDLNETYAVGKIDEESAKLISTTRRCLDEAIKVCKPGALFRDIGKVMYVASILRLF